MYYDEQPKVFVGYIHCKCRVRIWIQINFETRETRKNDVCQNAFSINSLAENIYITDKFF